MLLVHKEQIMAINDRELLKTAVMVQNAANLLLPSSRIPPKCLVRDVCDLQSARSPSIILSCPSLPVQAMLPALPSKLFTPLDFFPPQKLRRPERGRPSVSGGNFDPTFNLVCTVGIVPSLPGRCPFLLSSNIELPSCRTCTLWKESGHLFAASLKLKLLCCLEI